MYVCVWIYTNPISREKVWMEGGAHLGECSLFLSFPNLYFFPKLKGDRRLKT